MNTKLKQFLFLFAMLILFGSGLQAQITVSGQVVDSSDGSTLPGVSIIVEGTTIGTSTDFDGYYSIEVNNTDDVLSFSFIGYKTKQVKYKGKPVIDVALETDATVLEEAVVVGFGKQKKISVTGSVTAIKPGELKTSSTNLSNSFAGRMAGVVSIQRSSEPGADQSDFWIRGVATFGEHSAPLVYLDGAPITTGDMNTLDPAIIEDFTILKDASATALYGAKGANGVILITTKSGIVSDKPEVNIRFESSMQTPTMMPEFADAITYMNVANEARMNQNPYAPTKYSQEKIIGTQEGYDEYLFPNVDWMNTIFRPVSQKQYLNANIRGGGKKV